MFYVLQSVGFAKLSVTTWSNFAIMVYHKTPLTPNFAKKNSILSLEFVVVEYILIVITLDCSQHSLSSCNKLR